MSDGQNTPPIIEGYQLQACGDDLRDNLLRINSPLCIALQAMKGTLLMIRNRAPEERAVIITKEFAFQLSQLPDSKDETIFVFVTPPATVKRLLDEGVISFQAAVQKEFGRHLSQIAKLELYKACGLLFLERLCADGDKLAAVMN